MFQNKIATLNTAQHKLNRPLTTGLVRGLLLLILFSISMPSFSQDDTEELDPITVIGSPGMTYWIIGGIYYAIDGGSGAGGSSSTSSQQQTADAECDAMGADDRMDLATAAFIYERTQLSAMDSIEFIASYPKDSTYEFELPNGSVIRRHVSAAGSSVPFLAEESNSCEE